MAFKATLSQEEYDALDPIVQKEYNQKGDKWEIQVTGMVPKKQLDDFRNANIEMKGKLEVLGDLPPEKIVELKEKQEEIEASHANHAQEFTKKVDEKVATIKGALEKKANDATALADQYRGELAKEKIHKTLTEAGLKAGLRQTAIDDLLARGERVFSLNKDGKTVEALDADGNPVYDGSDVLTMDRFVLNLSKSAPHLFEESEGSESKGGGGGGGGGFKPGNNPWKQETWNLTEQGKLIRSDKSKARTLAIQAGAKVDF